MVQAIENRAVVTCRYDGEPTDGPNQAWVDVPVAVVTAEPVEGFPNLLADDLPRSVTAMVPRELWQGRFADHEAWRAEVELVGPGRMRVRQPMDPPEQATSP